MSKIEKQDNWMVDVERADHSPPDSPCARGTLFGKLHFKICEKMR
ncbi:MAG: hypothetical protein ACSHXD_14770 [Marinosulfonomonas sp.]